MGKTYGVALLGAGRMGMEHARTMLGVAEARVLAVADPNAQAAEAARGLLRAERIYADPEEAIHHPGVEAVVIVTPTDTHARYIELSAQAGKAIFCEKPVAKDLGETRRVLGVVEQKGLPFQIGFQRRYDPPYHQAKEKIEAGEIGEVEQFIAVMRDPAPAPLEYLQGSGGIFIDQSIHDIDCARFLVGEVEEVHAWGAVRVDPRIGEIGDVDTTNLSLRFANGALGVIQNSRRAVYGYDVRTEVFGSGGKLVMDATPKTPLWQYGSGVRADHYHFFMDRFKEAYRLELEAFFRALATGKPPTPGPKDAIESLRIALAATRSLKEGRPVRLEEIA
ncbi:MULTISPECIES: inositol 2-dehydrogenase [unclassified Meiothermus]|uniref:inositol 2-dehydrogenase n=1 Tax=unclassified Meiothermus TaxID=370471 RepID=UPI000D7C608C|nr:MULTISPECIES: inositol 2-dehydrogenase [unclassified Meiothermus]PZA06785.1 inositol 2-dehydrogenase [Meiothermus sp. Pnk-1]RYM33656.1 inositol 2-dehydrogenase [Meiothermus sp. PNK-Is4]